jgi:hypothetical protein
MLTPSGSLLAATLEASIAGEGTGPPREGTGQTAVRKADFPVVTGKLRWTADGSLHALLRRMDGRQSEGLALRYHFGLPEQPPVARWLEDETLPIHHARWEHADMQYTQIALISRIEPGDLMPDGLLPADAVILVQLTGLSVASEYVDATATFQVEIEFEPIDLKLDRGVVRAIHAGQVMFLAAVQVPAEGIETHHGPQLRFRGHMPPGTFGAMTIKIPLGPLGSEEAFERLHDLEFDDEFRRVKRYWKSRLAGDAESSPSLILSDPPIPVGTSNL